MTRISTISLSLSALMLAGSAVLAQTTPPPQTGTAGQAARPSATPTPTQTPKPTTPPEPFPPDAKVAYIDLQLVVRDSKLGKKGHDAMQALTDKRDADLSAKAKDLQALQERIKTQQGIVTDAVIQGMSRDLDKKTRDAQFAQQEWQVQIDQLNQELLGSFQLQVLPIVEELRKEKGLWIIFALGDNSNIAAAHTGLDLSLEIIKRLDAKTK